jgi:hypothetical protein
MTRIVAGLRRPAFWFALLALLGYAGGLELAVSHGPAGSVQTSVTAYLDRSEKKAVEAFAIARTINAAVSLLKSADLSAVVAQVAPMQVLEPVDDLAKQFSDVMVISIVAILLQRLLLGVSQAWAFTCVLPTGCVLLVVSLMLPRWPLFGARLAALGRMLILLALFARFSILAAGLAGEALTAGFLNHDLDSAMAVMQRSGGSLDQFTSQVATHQPPPATPPGTASLFDRLKNAVQATTTDTQSWLNAARAWVPDAQALNAMVAGLPDQIVKAIAIFLVQTILTPLLAALFLYAVLRQLLRPAL